MENNPFEGIIVDERIEDANKNLLAELVRDFVKIGKTDGNIGFEDKFYDGSLVDKAIRYLLARKIVAIQGLIKDYNEYVMTGEIAKAIREQPKAVSARLGDTLFPIVTKKNEGYSIPNYKLEHCKKVLSGKAVLKRDKGKNKSQKTK